MNLLAPAQPLAPRPRWTTACPDWEQRIVERRSLVPFDPLFPAEADAALEIFNDLVLVDVAGKPRMAQACLPWAFDLPRTLFGAYDPAACGTSVGFLSSSPRRTRSPPARPAS